MHMLRSVLRRFRPTQPAPVAVTPPDLAADAEFLELWKLCRAYSMTSIERMYGLYQAVQYLTRHGIAGDFVECGVWRGGSTMLMAYTALASGDPSRRLWLFDTFTGMPPPSAADRDYTGIAAAQCLATHPAAELFRAFAPLDEVRQNIHTTGYPSDLVTYVAGKVEVTIPAHMPDSIALLRLDTDWYESTKHELQHLYGRVVQGGIVILDDYGWWQGAKAAVDEFFAVNGPAPLMHRLDSSGRLLVKS
jgi:hypothetical protein